MKTSTIAMMILSFGKVLYKIYSMIGMKTKYAEITLDIVVESISLDPKISNTLNANDSKASTKH